MLKLKKTIAFSAVALMAATSLTSTAVNAEVSANVAATSNYLWRGQEQTGGDAAISGGIDYADESGFYAGTWVSNASWADEMTYELDFYAGFGGDISEGVSYDVGYIYYAYPDAASSADADFSEIYGSISVEGFTFGASVLATSAASGDGTDFGDSLYLTSYSELSFSIVEYNPQRRLLNDIMFNLPNERGLGTFFWEPVLSGEWGLSMFTKNGNVYTAKPEDFLIYDKIVQDYGLSENHNE